MMMKFSCAKLGINIHLAGIRHFGLDEKKTVETMLSLPYQHVRIPIPYDEIAPKKGTWDFAKRDWVITEALKKNKTIHLQLGAKTIGWPEVWLPKWLTDEQTYVHKPYACIDEKKQVQDFLLEALETALKQYIKLSHLGSIHIENEAFCRRLSVANYRYISFDFHQQELAIVKKHNKKHIPVLQNLPLNHLFDMLQSLQYVFLHSDIIGLNIYNQHSTSEFKKRINTIGITAVLPFIKHLSRLLQKRIYITELQTAAWLSKGKPIAPFSHTVFKHTLHNCFRNNAEIVFLWDVEQILAYGTKEEKRVLSTIA
jgi:hypothetical protein